mmetsp:Transcript_17977/g.54986  ORF Transcript_17977/g.54986 Transcript_17977/m.54986 type:complete len:224 (+) Transcript_17977:702-1373(+)
MRLGDLPRLEEAKGGFDSQAAASLSRLELSFCGATSCMDMASSKSSPASEPPNPNPTPLLGEKSGLVAAALDSGASRSCGNSSSRGMSAEVSVVVPLTSSSPAACAFAWALRPSLRLRRTPRMKTSKNSVSSDSSSSPRAARAAADEALRFFARQRWSRVMTPQLGRNVMVERPTRIIVGLFMGSFHGFCRYMSVPLLERRSCISKPFSREKRTLAWRTEIVR